MRISIVVAMTPDRIIGKDGRLPWHLPADLKHFRRITMGHPVIMGRRTFESIGKPLKGRTNIIITRQDDYEARGCEVEHSIEAALETATRHDAVTGQQPEAGKLHSTSHAPLQPELEVMVIGGSSIYRAFLPRVRRMYVTIVHARVDGDTWFPEFDRKDWRESERVDHEPDSDNPHPYSFTVLDRQPG